MSKLVRENIINKLISLLMNKFYTKEINVGNKLKFNSFTFLNKEGEDDCYADFSSVKPRNLIEVVEKDFTDACKGE